MYPGFSYQLQISAMKKTYWSTPGLNATQYIFWAQNVSKTGEAPNKPTLQQKTRITSNQA